MNKHKEIGGGGLFQEVHTRFHLPLLSKGWVCQRLFCPQLTAVLTGLCIDFPRRRNR